MPETVEPFRLDNPAEWALLWANKDEYARVQRYLRAFNLRIQERDFLDGMARGRA